MISKVRSYIKSVITATQPTYTEWDDGFAFDNIPSNIRDKSYFILYSIVGTRVEQNVEYANIEATLRVFYDGARYVQSAIDTAMDDCNEIRLNIIDVNTISDYRSTDNNPIMSIESVDQVPEPLESNDNKFEVVMTFNMEIAQTLC